MRGSLVRSRMIYFIHMERTNISIIIIVLILGLGVYVVWSDQKKGPSLRNVDVLMSSSETAIVTEDVTYTGDTEGYFVRPEAEGVYPGVVLIHENRGLRPEIRQTAEDLARQGYLVLAVDLLGDVVETQEEARALTAVYNQEEGVRNMRSAVQYLRDQGATKIASLGWCFGGRQSLLLALSGESLDATIIYYGGLVTDPEELSIISQPVLGIFAENDQAISTESVGAFGDALMLLNIEHEIHIYPGVGHAFANPSGMNYAPEATKDAWTKTLSFLERTLK